MRRLFRWMAALFLLAASVLGVSYLQGRFDRLDLTKAVRAVEAKVPGAEGCRAKLISRLHGTVRVDCGERKWTVDVVRGIMGEQNG